MTVSSDKNKEKDRKGKVDEFLQFCDKVGKQAQERGLTEEKLQQILKKEKKFEKGQKVKFIVRHRELRQSN